MLVFFNIPINCRRDEYMVIQMDTVIDYWHY